MSFEEDLAHAFRVWDGKGDPKPISNEARMQQIERIVSGWFRIPVDVMRSKSKADRITQARYVAWWITRQTTRDSFPTIGRYWERDHSSVIHGYRKIERRMQREPEFAKTLAKLALLARNA